jgi:hypothetical protein
MTQQQQPDDALRDCSDEVKSWLVVAAHAIDTLGMQSLGRNRSELVLALARHLAETVDLGTEPSNQDISTARTRNWRRRNRQRTYAGEQGC